MHEANWWCRRGLIAAVCALGVLTVPAWGDPHFAIRTPQDWEYALLDMHVRPMEPAEWSEYMIQWQSYLMEGEPYPTTEFLPAELYVSPEGGGGGGAGGGMVMLWGGTGDPDGQYASAWMYDYQLDPDLSNSMISLSVFAVMARPTPTGVVKINQISFGIQDIFGNTRSWYWNVGPGTKVPWNVIRRFTIDCSQTGVNATTPPADSYMSNPAFDIAQSQFFIADENGLAIAGALAIPPPPTPHPGIWNLWHDIVVLPHWDYKWQQPPDPAYPTNLFLGWNEPSDYWNGPIVADDWVCTTADPVTDVHWWGSFIGWAESTPPQLPNHFHIQIWDDVPKNPSDPSSFSHPGNMLQEFLAYPTNPNFTTTFVGWDFDPRMNQYEACFRFDYDFQLGEQFAQATGQNIYWVSISACEAGGTVLPYPFGWKTRPRDPNSTAPDDAVVITDPIQPVSGSVYNAGYPIWFPTPQESWDMAFELTSKTEATKVWDQPPDTSPMGMDVNATRTRVSPILQYTLADDFQCTLTGPITQIVVFGSWYHDQVPTTATFRFSLHSDVPVGDPNNLSTFSHPGTLLWSGTFVPGTYEYDPYITGLVEGWYDPNSTTYDPNGDTVCWRFVFNLDPTDPNTPIQYGTPEPRVIYWLDVHATTTSGTYFGWKTSPMHWNDAAVWAYAVSPAPNAWRMLTYPATHPFHGQPIDLAFQIIGQGGTPQKTKWSQPPEPYEPADAFNGWDQYSVYGSSAGIVADDWVCTSPDPVSDIHWWGSFIGWDETYPPQLPDQFHIGIWTDVPSDPLDPTSFSHPGYLLWENWCSTYEWGFAGWDFDPRVPIVPSPRAPEATFEFTQYIPREQWFPQEPNTIYWLSIAAVYSTGIDPEYPFGWKTRPRDLTSLAPDDAVVIYDPTAPLPGVAYVSGSPIEYPAGTSWDMAFEITTSSRGDNVVCEPQGAFPNPFHPPTYWYDVTPLAPRYDFHVRVYDTNPANYTNVVAPAGWLFSVHQLLINSEWWASWWDPTCTNPITATFRFQFDNPGPSVWDEWKTTTSCTDDPYNGVADQWLNHGYEPDGYGYRVHVPKPYRDVVVCEPQGSVGNPFHPPTYWYDVTPDRFGRCDFHVRVYDPNPALYTNPSLPAATWQFSVHQLANGEWWASWWDPNCTNAIFSTFRFQFDHRNPSVWGEWTTTISATDDPNNQVVDLAANHATETDGYGYRVHVPRALSDVVVCEPQGGVNPTHPPTYWYDVTPDYFGRCDFHVRVYDTILANYTNVSLPASTWQFAVHQIPSGEWYASWWDPNCTNAIFSTFRFQFDNPNASTWDHWTTTISATNDPFASVIDRSENHSAEADGYGYRVHVPQEATEACCMPDASCLTYTTLDCILAGGVPQGVGTSCDLFVCPWHKWSQPPTSNLIQYPLFYGWDDPSTYYGPVVADDWQCVDQRPVTDIHWWGSYRYWQDKLPPATAPQAFHVGIWTDVPIGPNNPVSWSHPGSMFHEYFVLRSELNERAVGMDQHPDYGRETCFQYDLKLPKEQWFWQDVQYHIFWISISAVYGSPCNGDLDHDGDVDTNDVNIFNACLMPPTVPECWQADLNGDGLVDFNDVAIMQCQQAAGWPNPACCAFTPVVPENVWGWKTRLPHWNDDAVRIYEPLPPRMRTGWEFDLGEPIEDAYGTSWDTSFVLTTQYAPPPPPCIGDMNCDGWITYADINPFVQAISSAAAYQKTYPSCRYMNADCSGDGIVSYADINPFVALMGHPGPCP